MTHVSPQPISLTIITKNRAQYLNDCLTSIKNQSIYPIECIIIDSSDTQETKKIVEQWKKRVPFRIQYIYEPRSGFPIARNQAIQHAHGTWIASIDDDCIADKQWIRAMYKSIQHNPHVSAILGKTMTIYRDNPIARATELNETYWKARGRFNTNITDLEILDNKNIVLSKKFLTQKNIRYDESRVFQYNGASEDCDLGMQIQSKGGKAKYNPSMIVFHKDPTDIISYLQHKVLRTRAHLTYEHKWENIRSDIKHTSAHQKIKFFLSYIKQEQLCFINSCITFIMLTVTYILIRWLKLSSYLSHKTYV